MRTKFMKAIEGRGRALTKALGLALLAGAAIPAFATDFGDYAPIQAGFNAFLGHIAALTTAAISAPDYVSAIDLLWAFFAFIMVIMLMVRFAFKGATMLDILETALNIGMNRVLSASYNVLTAAIWGAGTGIGASIQGAMIGTSDLFFGPAFLVQLVSNITPPDFSFTSVVSIYYSIVASIILGIIALVLGALSFIVSIWGVWGYALAKIIGALFIPFLLFKPLQFLFDGWLRFFMGFIVYMLVARINTVLVVCALALYFGFPIPPSPGAITPIVIPSITNLTELMGIIVFALVGIVALISTGKFASAIVQGAGGGGVGLALQSATGAVARAAMML